MTEPDRRPRLSAAALRLVLARIDDGWADFDGTLAEIDDHDLRPIVQFLAGVAAGIWISARGKDTAVSDITEHVAAQLDAAADQHREDHP